MSKTAFISELFSSVQGEGLFAGRRQIFLRLMECNLDCRYCDTDFALSPGGKCETAPGSGVYRDFPQPVTLPVITSLMNEWVTRLPGAHHSISLTGGEPLVSVDTLIEWLPELGRLLPVHLETNGTLHRALQQVKPLVRHISMDIKLPSTSGIDRSLWEEHALFLREAYGTSLAVKIVVSGLTTPEEVRQVADVISAVDAAIPLFIQPLSLPDGSVGIGAGALLLLQELVSTRLSDVRVIPQMHRMLGAL